MPDFQKTANSRVFLIPDMANLAAVPTYQGFARAMAPDWSNGDRTPIRVPDPARYGQFITVGFIDGQRGLPTLGIQQRYARDLPGLLSVFRQGCPIDIQVHMGACEDPSDFDRGWQKILVLENARPNNWSADELGAFDADTNAAVNEEMPFTGVDMYEVLPLTFGLVAETQVTDEVAAITICDAVQCGECGIPSNGYTKVFAITKAATGSPGLPPELLYSNDGGSTFSSTNVSTMALADVPLGIACVGTNLVIWTASGTAGEFHYAPIADVLAHTETWTKITTGLVAAKFPRAVVSLGRTKTWVVGDGGYVYFTADITAGFTVQSAGDVTAQNLGAIAAFDEKNLMAVGAANATLVTRNGGTTWTSVTGPIAATVLTAVETRRVSVNEWFVGAANGNLYYTRNGGSTWTVRAFTGSGAGSVAALSFATPSVGYMAHNVTAGGSRGRIFRTLNGGGSWYALPDATGQTMPLTDRFNDFAVTKENVNFVLAAGLGDNGTDGAIAKGSAPSA